MQASSAGGAMLDAGLEDRRGAKPQTSRWDVQKVAAEARENSAGALLSGPDVHTVGERVQAVR